MKKTFLFLICLGVILSMGSIVYAVPFTDTVEFPTGYFVPDEASALSSPYYRWYNEDWGWQHNAIAATVESSASLLISSFDVDSDSYDPEVDLIYAFDASASTWIELGSLIGLGSQWSYTEFILPTALYDEIETGLQIFMDIDSTHSNNYWAVTLAKSVISIDGSPYPDPDPGTAPVPEPGTIVLMGLGLVGLAGMGRKKLFKK